MDDRYIADCLKHMTKEEIYHAVKKSGCPMLRGLRLLHLKKEVLIDYLEKKDCPELKRLILNTKKDKD
jgi:hypothetical protein